MNEHIVTLLKTESTVIIPEFGALMKNGSTLLFNPILKFNDGKLRKYISKKENISEEEADLRIKDYVKTILSDLKNGDTFIVKKLGTFFLNNEGKVSFASEGVSIPEIRVFKEETKKLEKLEKVITPTPSFPTKKESPREEQPVKKEKKITKSIPEVSTKPKKKKKTVWIIAVFILLLLAGIGVGLNWHKIKEIIIPLSNTKTSTYTDSIAKIEPEINLMEIIDTIKDTLDVLPEQKASVLSIDSVKEKKKDADILTKDMVYHITVGSFGNKENAQALVSQMRMDGLKHARILSTSGSLYKVVAGSYISESDAMLEMDKALKYNAQAYIIKQ